MPLCGARRRDGGTCTQYAMHGGTRCKMHGGLAPATMARAAQRVELEKAAKVAQQLGYDPVANPLIALQELAGEALAIKNQLASLREHDSNSAAAYERAFSMAARIVTDMSRMALDERLARIDNAMQDRMIESLLSTILHVVERLGHDPHSEPIKAILLDELEATRRALNAAPDLRPVTAGS